MASAVVYENVAEDADLKTGSLFQDKKFWVAQRVPHRAALLDLIKANGGSIVLLEKQADWMIADHFRKLCPPGSISYDFVHKSIAKGEILDPNDFPAGPRIGTARDPGSIARPAKGTRTAFTPDEDRQLYKWARDAQANGVAVSGNELYKKLEEKNPRHTWQSWRDRYLKKLQYQPPSAFNIPDNAPPSPPSDQSTRAVESPVARSSGLVKNKDKGRTVTVGEQSASVGTSTGKEQDASKESATSRQQAASREEYTIEQLVATFTTEDWESLYAFVEEIDNRAKEDASYDAAWTSWAESRDNQTAEQWRQYYERVVRPQWLQDSTSKRERIRKRVEERFADDSSSPTKSQSWSQTQNKTVAASQATESAPVNHSKRTVSNVIPSDSRLASESTAQHETPKYIRDGYESALKRIRGEVDHAPESTELSRPTKIRRRISLSPEEPVDVAGTQEQPLEISSAADSPKATAEQQQRAEDDFERVAQEEDGDDLESIASSTDLTHIAPLPRPPEIPEDEDDEDDEDDLPSNTPTPRANKFAAFDTQAILSPSQNPNHISVLPRPPLDSSPPYHPESEASTTQSLQEFSSYLQETTQDNQPQPQPHFTRLPRPTSPTPSATSSTSSTGSGDPDEPLAADEIDDFFAEQHAEGFSDEFITKALKRTRFRPGLAMTVLEAWRRGDALPGQRGIWSVEEDEMVESGDGAALARLQRKHTLDGWGGITERMNFLRAWERR